MSNEITKYGEGINNIISYVKKFDVIEQTDMKFLQENRDHIAKVFEKVHIWRTSSQKESIISDEYAPTLPSKMAQANCEMKVQADQSFILAKEMEMKKLNIEELNLDIEELEEKEKKDGISDLEKRRIEIQKYKKQIELQYNVYELSQMKIAMHYRLDEVKGWKRIQDRLIKQMKEQGIDEDTIWNKEKGEIESMFFQFLLNYHGIEKSTDGAERSNLFALARFGIRQAKEAGIFKQLLLRCNQHHIASLIALQEITQVELDEWKLQHGIK